MAKKKGRRRKKSSLVRAYIARAIAIAIVVLIGAGIYVGVKGVYTNIKTSSEQKKAEENAVGTRLEFTSKGAITETIVEDFDSSIYNADELEAMVSDEIVQYATISGDEKLIKLKNIETEDQVAKVSIEYASPEDYRAFNNTDIYFGKVSDLIAKCILFDKNLVAAVEGQENISADKISTLGKYKAIVVSQPCIVKAPKNVVYYSEGTSLVNKRCVSVPEDNEGLSFIIFK